MDVQKGFGVSFERHYGEVLAIARARVRKEWSPISTGTLAHEIFLNLRHREDLNFASREQFLAYVGGAMRSMLVDMARERMAQKRSAELMPLTLGDDVCDVGGGTPEQILAISQAIAKLGRLDERLLKVADLHVLLGLELPDIACALGISEPTVKREWRRVKAYLHDALCVTA